MENEQINVQSGKKTAKTWANLVSIALSVLAFGFLFLTLVKFKDAEGNKSFLHISDIFGAEKFQFMFVIGYALLIASIPLLIAAYFFEKKGNSLSTGAVVCQFLAAVSFVMTPMLYLESMEGNSCSMEIGLGLAFASSLAASLFSFIYAFSKKPMSIHDIAEDAILVAAAFALNFIKIPVGETGGSINLQLLPIYIIALRHGPFQGIISGGIVLGILTCFTDGYGFVSFHYDYLIGLGSAGLLGFFKPLIMSEKQKSYNVLGEIFIFVGILVATIVRMGGGIASSMTYYGMENEFWGAFEYNILYVGPSALICAVILMGLYGPLLRVNKLLPARD